MWPCSLRQPQRQLTGLCQLKRRSVSRAGHPSLVPAWHGQCHVDQPLRCRGSAIRCYALCGSLNKAFSLTEHAWRLWLSYCARGRGPVGGQHYGHVPAVRHLTSRRAMAHSMMPSTACACTRTACKPCTFTTTLTKVPPTASASCLPRHPTPAASIPTTTWPATPQLHAQPQSSPMCGTAAMRCTSCSAHGRLRALLHAQPLHCELQQLARVAQCAQLV